MISFFLPSNHLAYVPAYSLSLVEKSPQKRSTDANIDSEIKDYILASSLLSNPVIKFPHPVVD